MKKGEKIGRYVIKRKIGAGGMGEVFLARDEQLDRDVALKILLSEFCSDTDRVKRFKFEAKTASSLNHPNIITIYEIVQENESLFIATEFVDGVTLRKRIEQGDLTMYEAIRIAEQVADALAVAHNAHIVHRDIKPENIMIRYDDYVKLLDFGLAKPKFLPLSGTEDDTIQMVKTQPGLVMGSVRYMSPEQARGKETDQSTDVWSLGVVLYEMLTGENPFEGETVSDSLAALIHIEPNPVENIPEKLSALLTKALKKDAKERYQSIRDFAVELKSLRKKLEKDSNAHEVWKGAKTNTLPKQNTSESKTLIHQTVSSENKTASQTAGINATRVNTVSRSKNLKYIPAVFVTVAVLLAFATWFYLPALFASAGSSFDSIRVSRLTDDGNSYGAAVSPDGKLLAHIVSLNRQSKLVVRQISTGSQVEVVSFTDSNFLSPTFSPDGEFIYYVLLGKGVGVLYKVSTLGGQSQKIAEDVDSRVAVSHDGKRLAFHRHNPQEGGDTVYLVDSDGKNLTEIIGSKQVEIDRFGSLMWTDEPNILLVSGISGAYQPSNKVSVITVDTETKETEEPEEFDEINDGRWNSAGRFVWLKNNSGVIFIGKKNAEDTLQIWNLSFTEGKVKPITTDTSDYRSLSISDDGKTLVATKVERNSSLLEFDQKTKQTKQIMGESKTFAGYLGVSQTVEGRILYSKKKGKDVNIFSLDEAGGKEIQLTSNQGVNIFPVATSDGKYIVFSSSRNGSIGIWRMDSDGSNPVELAADESGRDTYPQIINQGKSVIFTRRRNDGGKASLIIVPIDGGEAKPLFPNGNLTELLSQISPDGKSLVFLSYKYNEGTAKIDAFLKFADINGEKITMNERQMDFDLNQLFRWSPDGKSIDFLSNADRNVGRKPLSKRQESVLTSFNSSSVVNFTWANDGKKMFIVKSVIDSDLILIKDSSGT